MDVSENPMTEVVRLLAELDAVGLAVELDPDGGIACTGPEEAMTVEMAARIGATVDALVAHLVAAQDREAMDRLDADLGTDRWGVEFDPTEDPLGAPADDAAHRARPRLSASGRSWWCRCGASVVVGWWVCPFCGARGDHLRTARHEAWGSATDAAPGRGAGGAR